MAVIVADQNNVTVNGTDGADSISGSASLSLILGGGGADTIGPLGGGDTIRGGAGDDSIIASSGGRTYGEEGADTITGLPDETANYIEGGPGNDLLDGDPEEGRPFVSYAMYTTATSGVTVSLSTEAPQDVGGGQGVDVVKHFNGVVGSAFGDRLTGGPAGAAALKLFGEDGDDRLEAGTGDVEFFGGVGDDIMVGGGGNSFASYIWANFDGSIRPTGPLTIDLRITGPQDVGGGMGHDTFLNVTGVGGAAYGDSLTGSDAANFLSGDDGNDTLQGLGGDDQLYGGAGDDTVFGGDGNDTLDDLAGQNFLRGEAGDDKLSGSNAFDDLHGNMGNDTVAGRLGNDWVVGGKDNDSLSGDGGDDVVYGNLGEDSCDGGDGADIVRGGQGNDVVLGGAGDDFVSGDRGDDTVTGGAGADRFHTFGDAGIDRVTDFNVAEGDRVMLDPGTTYTVAQVGADTVVSMGGGGQMVLVGVATSSLTGSWIFGA